MATNKNICYLCGEQMVEQKDHRVKYKWGKYEFIIKGITAYICECCGEEVYSYDDTLMMQKLGESLEEADLQNKPDIINVSDVADLLKVTNQTVYNMIKDGRLKSYKIGKEWRFMRKDILSILSGSGYLQAARGNVSLKDQDIISEVIKEM